MTDNKNHSKSTVRINKMSLENDRYFELFKSELAQIHDKSISQKRDLQESLLADLIELSAKDELAKDFFGLSARDLARNWAEELPVPSFLEAVKAGVVPSLLPLAVIILSMTNFSRQGRKWTLMFIGPSILLAMLGPWLLSKLFPKMTRKERQYTAMTIAFLIMIVGIVYLFVADINL